MQKLCLIFLTMLSFIFSGSAYGEGKRYISDKLVSYIYSDPSNQSEIVGTLNTGDEVVLLGVDEGDNYGRIRDNKNRTAWIPLDQLVQTPVARGRPSSALEQQVKSLGNKLTTIENSWSKRVAEMQQRIATSDNIIAKLQQENKELKELKNKLANEKKSLTMADLLQDKTHRAVLHQWFMYGGGVAGFGLLLGLMLPHVIPTRKKKDRWMS